MLEFEETTQNVSADSEEKEGFATCRRPKAWFVTKLSEDTKEGDDILTRRAANHCC
jgi:hypothetical protein